MLSSVFKKTNHRCPGRHPPPPPPCIRLAPGSLEAAHATPPRGPRPWQASAAIHLPAPLSSARHSWRPRALRCCGMLLLSLLVVPSPLWASSLLFCCVCTATSELFSWPPDHAPPHPPHHPALSSTHECSCLELNPGLLPPSPTLPASSPHPQWLSGHLSSRLKAETLGSSWTLS